VCEDKLGIGAELEADIQRVIDTYECEWKKTINDPGAMRRFRHFINSDHPDSHIVFVDERGRPRPALPAERAMLGETV
jgi:nitrite reductase (NADH) large subunit